MEWGEGRQRPIPPQELRERRPAHEGAGHQVTDEAHAKARKRLYHPVPRAVSMSSERTTARYHVHGGSKLLQHDDWRDSTRTEDDLAWRGCTFGLKRLATVTDKLYGEAASTVGSYEMVDS